MNKNYVGKGWESANGFYINIKLNKEQLDKLPVNNFGEISLTVTKRKEVDEKSKATHSVSENDFVPTKQ